MSPVNVKNPLSVIAIFAALAEVAGTGVLPFIAETNQATYIWFLMMFPVLLVGLFFLTLNFNSRVLYAPSDFQDEKNYMDIFRPSTPKEKLLKIQSEEIAEESSTPELTDDKPNDPKQKSALQARLLRLASTNPMMVETLIVERLATEFNTVPMRDVAFAFGTQRGTVIDAAFKNGEGYILVEVKYISGHESIRRTHETVKRIASTFASLPEDAKAASRFVLAIGHEMSNDKAIETEKLVTAYIAQFAIPVEVRMFDLKELVLAA